MKLSDVTKSDLEIYWQESSDYILLYLVYSLVIVAITFYFDSKHQPATGAAQGIILLNASVWVFSIILFVLGMFVTGWVAESLGGEVSAFFIVTVITFISLFAVRIFLIARLQIGMEPGYFRTIVSTIFLQLPFIAFHVFAFMLAADDWRN